MRIISIFGLFALLTTTNLSGQSVLADPYPPKPDTTWFVEKDALSKLFRSLQGYTSIMTLTFPDEEEGEILSQGVQDTIYRENSNVTGYLNLQWFKGYSDIIIVNWSAPKGEIFTLCFEIGENNTNFITTEKVIFSFSDACREDENGNEIFVYEEVPVHWSFGDPCPYDIIQRLKKFLNIK